MLVLVCVMGNVVEVSFVRFIGGYWTDICSQWYIMEKCMKSSAGIYMSIILHHNGEILCNWISIFVTNTFFSIYLTYIRGGVKWVHTKIVWSKTKLI